MVSNLYFDISNLVGVREMAFMTRPLRILYANAYYHVTCRGNEGKAIFRDDTDRSLFLDKLNSLSADQRRRVGPE